MTCTISHDPVCVLLPPGGQTNNNTAGQYMRNKDFILNLCCYKQLKLKAATTVDPVNKIKENKKIKG